MAIDRRKERGLGSARILFIILFLIRLSSWGTPTTILTPLPCMAETMSGPFMLWGYVIEAPRKTGTRKVHMNA
jgi:hypothetical protein